MNELLSRARFESDPLLPPSKGTTQWVVFRLDEGRYALPLASIERVVRAVLVTPVPGSPAVVLGAIDIAGRVLPVLSVRWRFGLPERGVDPACQFLITHTGQRPVALVIDRVETVIEYPVAAIVEAGVIDPRLEHVCGILRLPDGLVLIQDLERLLSADEARMLDEALTTDGVRAP